MILLLVVNVCYCDATVCIIVDHLMQGPVLKGAIKKKIKYPCVFVCVRERVVERMW